MTRKLLVSNIAVVVLLVLGLTYVLIYLIRYNPLDPPYSVTVRLHETGGLYSNSDVTYLGDPIGRITSIKPQDGGVTVTVSIRAGVQIPRDTRAIVAGLSPVGEQYLDFEPRGNGAPYLSGGDVIPASDTAIPVAFPTMMRHVYDLASQIHTGPISTVVTELARGLGDEQVDLRRTVRDSAILLDTLVKTRSSTVGLLNNGHTVLRTAVDLRPQLARFSASAHAFAHELQAGVPTWRNLIARGPGYLGQMVTVVRENTPALAAAMDDIAPFLSVVDARGPAMTTLLHETPAAAAALAPFLRDGWLNGVVYLAPTSKVCAYGQTNIPAPWIARPESVNLDRHCTTYGPDMQQRGAYFAPRP